MEHIEEKLYADLTQLAHKILRLKEKEDVGELKKNARLVYEKIAVLDFVREQQKIFPKNTAIVNEVKKLATTITRPTPAPKKTAPETKLPPESQAQKTPPSPALSSFGKRV